MVAPRPVPRPTSGARGSTRRLARSRRCRAHPTSSRHARLRIAGSATANPLPARGRGSTPDSARKCALAPLPRLDLGEPTRMGAPHVPRQLIIHRYLKPSNVIGRADTGARARLLRGGRATSSARAVVTQTGDSPGTPTSCRPRQARDATGRWTRAPTSTARRYALRPSSRCMPPFAGPHLIEVLKKVAWHEARARSSELVDLPGDATVIRRSMAPSARTVLLEAARLSSESRAVLRSGAPRRGSRPRGGGERGAFSLASLARSCSRSAGRGSRRARARPATRRARGWPTRLEAPRARSRPGEPPLAATASAGSRSPQSSRRTRSVATGLEALVGATAARSAAELAAEVGYQSAASRAARAVGAPRIGARLPRRRSHVANGQRTRRRALEEAPGAARCVRSSSSPLSSSRDRSGRRRSRSSRPAAVRASGICGPRRDAAIA